MAKDSLEPVSEDEHVYRRIWWEFVTNKVKDKPVTYAAFKPTPNDHDGISVYREECGTQPQQLVAEAPNNYYVARLSVRDILAVRIPGRDIRLTVEQTAHLSDLPGHASVPQLTITVMTNEKPLYRDIANALANLTHDKIVLRPADRVLP
jgi:hypothetical protein